MKKIYLVLILSLVTGGIIFAQDDDFNTMPKNTITVDVGPMIVGEIFGFMGSGSIINGDGVVTGIETTGFGIAAQYERQLMKKMSVGGRFAYLSLGTEISDNGNKFTTDITSFSLEGHVRFYPRRQTFFVDGMLGYANLAINMKGSVSYIENNINKNLEVSFIVPRDYFKFGAKIGWRIDFGSEGGFVFEPSFGWYGGLGIGDTLGKSLVNEVNKKSGITVAVDIEELEETFAILENLIFIGGPRFCLSFGWRF
jgi:hypothetical protein